MIVLEALELLNKPCLTVNHGLYVTGIFMVKFWAIILVRSKLRGENSKGRFEVNF